MKIINLNLDYKREEEAIKHISNSQLSENYINYAVSSSHKDGLEGQMRRMYGRIQRKIDDVVEKDGKLELEESEYDFIKKSFEQAKFEAPLSKFVNILEDEIEKAGNLTKNE